MSLQSDKSVSPEDVYKIFEEGFGRAYDAGYRSVSLSIDWSVFYDGSRYSFSAYEIYYDLAKSMIWRFSLFGTAIIMQAAADLCRGRPTALFIPR